MKKIAVIENHYNVYLDRQNKVVVRFETDNHSVAIEDFEFYERMSEETNCFVGNLVLDGQVVGECRNEGRGGCASYYAHKNWDLANEIEKCVSNIECYTFPKFKLNLYDIIDGLVSHMLVFQENKVKTEKQALTISIELQKIADEYRHKYAK